MQESAVTGRTQATDAARSGFQALVERLVYPFRRGKSPPAHTPTGFYTDTTVCIGCKACEVACKQWNQLPADGLHWSGNSYDNTGSLSAESWRHVKFIEQFAVPDVPAQAHPLSPPALGGGGVAIETTGPVSPDLPAKPIQNRWLMMSDVCKHCATAPCQQACPTGAIIHAEFTNVYIQPDICNGCAYCIASCPFGVITRNGMDGHAHKCTLCLDRQRDDLVPACAKACPTQSIQFGPIDELRLRARRRVEELQSRGVQQAYLYGDRPTDTYSVLQSFYLLVDRPEVYGLPDKPFNPWLNMGGDYLRSLVTGIIALATFLLVLFLMER